MKRLWKNKVGLKLICYCNKKCLVVCFQTIRFARKVCLFMFYLALRLTIVLAPKILCKEKILLTIFVSFLWLRSYIIFLYYFWCIDWLIAQEKLQIAILIFVKWLLDLTVYKKRWRNWNCTSYREKCLELSRITYLHSVSMFMKII